jgi:hypothetical protein
MRSISFFFSLTLVRSTILFARAVSDFFIKSRSLGCHLVTLSRTVLPLASLGGSVPQALPFAFDSQTLFADAQRSSTAPLFSVARHPSERSFLQGRALRHACVVPPALFLHYLEVEAGNRVSMTLTFAVSWKPIFQRWILLCRHR